MTAAGGGDGGGLRRVGFRVALRVPVGGVTERQGWLVEGPEGWGEWSPLPSWSPAEVEAARRAAQEAATRPFPAATRPAVEVNALVPRVEPALAVRLVAESGCRTVKVKVGDEGDEDRVAAVREALGGAGSVRLDANGAWDLEEAVRRLGRLARFGVELCEDPVASMDDLARLRRRSPVPVAAEACVRAVDDARRLKRLDAADALVLKPQRIGGPRAALEAAEAAGVAAIASSALETSVGLAAVLAVAAALPEAPFAHGIGTGLLLERDVVADPLVPRDGRLVPRRPAVDPALLAAAAQAPTPTPG